jgi:hypothetical protein
MTKSLLLGGLLWWTTASLARGQGTPADTDSATSAPATESRIKALRGGRARYDRFTRETYAVGPWIWTISNPMTLYLAYATAGQGDTLLPDTIVVLPDDGYFQTVLVFQRTVVRPALRVLVDDTLHLEFSAVLTNWDVARYGEPSLNMGFLVPNVGYFIATATLRRIAASTRVELQIGSWERNLTDKEFTKLRALLR